MIYNELLQDPFYNPTKRLAQTKYLVVANSDSGYRQHIRSKSKKEKHPAGRKIGNTVGHPVTR